MPGYLVKVIPQGQKDAQAIDASTRVTQFTFEDLEKGADKLSLIVDNWDLSNFDNPLWSQGNELLVSWGYDGNMALERRMVIKSVKGSTVLTVEAMSRSVLLNQQRKARVFEAVKYSDIAHAIATEAGYSEASYRLIDDSEVVHEVVAQSNLTDAQFLRHLANKIRWEWYVDFDGFHFHPRRLGQRPLRKITYFTDPGEGEVLSFTIENDITAKPQAPTGAVQVKGRDPKEKKDISERADNATEKDRSTLGDIVKIVDPETGTRSYQQANAALEVKRTSAASAAQAKQEAKGAYRAGQTRTVVGTLRMVGDPNLVAKSIVEIEFPGAKRITGRYYVTAIKHTLSAAGDGSYTMELKVRRDATTATGQGGEVKTQGKTNTESPLPEDELTPKKLVDPETGTTTTVYTNSRGRQ